MGCQCPGSERSPFFLGWFEFLDADEDDDGEEDDDGDDDGKREGWDASVWT